ARRCPCLTNPPVMSASHRPPRPPPEGLRYRAAQRRGTVSEYTDFVDALREIGERYVPTMAGSDDPDAAAAVQRQVMHFLQYGLMAFFEYDRDRPVFHRMVSPTRKYLGDNPDALYYDAPVNPAHSYQVRG